MNQQGAEVVKGYVILRNLSKGPKGFSDHRNSPVMLDAFGGKNDQIKILLEESNLDKAVRHYVTYRKAAMQVTFSDGIIDKFPEFKDHLTVHSTAGVDQSLADRVEFVRKSQADKKAKEDSTAVRLARARAQNTISDNSKERTAMSSSDANPGEFKERHEAAPASKAPARAPMGNENKTEETEGVALTVESLSQKDVPELIEIAAKRGVNLKADVTKGAAVKSILLSLNK
jgi:hypothetical protein